MHGNSPLTSAAYYSFNLALDASLHRLKSPYGLFCAPTALQRLRQLAAVTQRARHSAMIGSEEAMMRDGAQVPRSLTDVPPLH